MKIEMSADEAFVRHVWYILDSIKEQLLLQKNKGKSIIYTLLLYPQANDWRKPNSSREQRLIEKLKELKIMEETEEKSDFQTYKGPLTVGNPGSAGLHYYFKINETAFNKYHDLYKKLVDQYNKADEEGDTLTFYGDGNIVYISPTGEIYKGKLGIKTNSYNILKFLAGNPREVFGFIKLAGCITKVSEQTEERLVRDVIHAVKKKLKYQGNDLFVSERGFGLKCKNTKIIN